MKLNQIYNVDCVQGLRELQNDCIDLTVTSPPYDSLRNYGGNYSFDFKTVAKALYRVTKCGGVVVWIVGDACINGSETGTSFKQALFFKDCGFRLHDTMIYKKQGVVYPEVNRYYQCFEYMFVLSKGKPKSVHLIADKPNKNAGCRKNSTERKSDGSLVPCDAVRNQIERRIKQFGVRQNIWEISQGHGLSTKDKIAFKHPAIFPEQLARDHILSWSSEGECVLDPFMGSGTVAKMAMLTGRNFIGFEISSEYCEIAYRRLEEARLNQ